MVPEVVIDCDNKAARFFLAIINTCASQEVDDIRELDFIEGHFG